MKKTKSQIVEVVRVGDGDIGRVVGSSLKKLREIRGLTQIQVAEHLSVGQASISKIENRGDVQISSLRKYVEALGAHLRIEAEFPPNITLGENIERTYEPDVSDINQLLFPLFGKEVPRQQRDVILSIKPQYSDKIIQGKKTVELRRRFPVSAPKGTLAYIYSTSPVRALVGRAEIADVLKLPVKEIWKIYSKTAFIEKNDFDAYFSGLTDGYALKFINARPLPRPINLVELRERFGFEPPQSFLYVNPVLQRALHNEYTVVSN